MANMTQSRGIGGSDPGAYEYTDTISGGAADGDYVLIPGVVQSIAVALIFGTGSGSVQYTLSTIAKVKAGTANWITWDAGTVSATTADVFYPCSAIRQVNATGTTIFEVTAR